MRYDTTNGDPCNGKSQEKKNTVVLFVAIFVPVLIVAILVSTLLVCYFFRKQATTHKEDHEDHIHISDGREFTYTELIEMTNNFSVCIGEGGYGPVFHG